MLSLQQAIEIKESILEYLKATFTFQDKKVHKAFYDFITHPREGIFKGPYLSLKLPFVKAKKEDIEKIPLSIKPDWLPYDHQVKSWHRLSTQKQKPNPTIITTGTGSGKTEAFMYPILDYCYRNQIRNGIKVIILYPMNALATDQAKRLAEAIYDDTRLKGKITAGLFIGEGKDASKYPKRMGASNIIENRETILSSPPDILLTNFKMLDYGLMKSNYHDLWLGNLMDNNLLQFLVLDELHTYDGAQGTDVANLIRRLKLKINIPKNHLCPIGTSATIGSGENAPKLLSEYASKIFGEEISTNAIITENRISPVDFFEEEDKLENFIPRPVSFKDIKPHTDEGYHNYLERQIKVWQLDRNNLADELKRLKIVKDLVSVFNNEDSILTLNEISRKLTNINADFKKNIPQWIEEYEFNPKDAIIQSLFAIISEAKSIDRSTGRKSPFLYTQTQIWIRELRGVLRVLDNKPKFSWKESIELNEKALALPPWFCRECGASGWIGVKHDNKTRFEKDINDIYSKFFSNHKHVYFFNRSNWFSHKEAAEAGYEPSDQFHKFVFNQNLEFFDEPDESRVDITAFKKLNAKGYNDHVCPECNTKNTISIIGSRLATLSSIAVSQTLSTDLDEQSEKDRKVLAFTNSVQDAAHQAGFIEARNYRFTFRSSLQKVVNQNNEPISLQNLTKAFIDYWKENADDSGEQPIEAYYYRFYPSDYLGKSSPKDYKNNGRYIDAFKDEFDTRIKWEIFSEFGYNAVIGRTLEKTGSSGIFFANKDMNEVWEKIQPWLAQNEPSQSIDQDSFIKFLFLLLYRLRTRGAINHIYLNKFRENNLKLWELNWMRDGRHFLNKRFGPRTRIPKLITSQKENRGLLDSTFAKTTNWFHAYFKKNFKMAANHIDFLNEFYDELIKVVVEVGIFNKKQSKEIENFALNPDKIWVTKNVFTTECGTCGHKVYSGETANHIEDGQCLNYRCSGTYKTIHDINTKSNYYQFVYNRKRSPRIFAADHTGLLERKKRELLEIDFKTRPHFNSKNAMVATSTLEMGIDIGSLNTAFNNSVPPLPSNFLQRVGRAGRATGSALIVNFSQTKSHDLYYFQEPLDMMAGSVNTPGCYLEAKEILKRHFFAFCLDSWTSKNSNDNHVPAIIKYMKIESTDLKGSEFFMNRILNFIKANQEDLFNDFKFQYENEVSGEVFDELRLSLNNEQFYFFHSSIFQKLKDEIKFIKEKRKDIDKLIKDLKLGKEDPARIELEKELKNLWGIIIGIKKRNTFEHLTNIGALPNYAFPETGVTLTAKVIGNKAEGSVNTPLNKDFEIVRSASQAIKEFAPDNYFYSQSYRFKISGINTFDWSDKNVFHKKRFCSNCDHIDLVETADRGVCPKCGDESWGASSNVHAFAKLLTVKSFNNQSDATLGDGSDERENIHYSIIRHFSFNNSKSHGVWAMKEIPFGIEFVKNVRITDTNLGRLDVVNSRKIQIKEQEVPAHGFITCKHCGKSSSKINQKDYKHHYAYCKHKDEDYKGLPDDIFEEVFFFREIETEALKILLPVQEFNSEADIKMFKAGIELGLKKYFKGNPQHISISNYNEYNHRTQKFDKYLVMFDTIPGGTGYLEKLFNWKEFNELLKIAYKEISECNCQHEGKDGCYRCIYSYGNQYDQSELSRKRAEKRFYDIVRKSESWESFASGLNNITNSGQIEESELEERFIRSLKLLASNRDNWIFNEVNEDGIINYTLEHRSDSGNTFGYHIRPQVNLGQNDGIKYHTRTDFLIICTHAIVKGKKLKDLHHIPKIAVYLDGYQFHASSEYNRFENDLQKRKAINNSSEYKTWTLTWRDIDKFDENFLEASDQKNRNDFLELILNQKGFKTTKANLIKATKGDEIKLYEAKNNFERFLKLLSHPICDQNFKKGWSLYLALFQKYMFKPSFAPADIEKAFENINKEQYCIENKTPNGLIPLAAIPKNQLFEQQTIINIANHQVKSRLRLLNTEEIENEAWNIFWVFFNLIQFFDLNQIKAEMPEKDMVEYSIEDLLNQFDEPYHSVLKKLYESGEIRSEKDEVKLYSLTDKNNNIIAEAEFIINEQKIVIGPFSEQDKIIFEKNGYKILTKDKIKDIKI